MHDFMGIKLDCLLWFVLQEDVLLNVLGLFSGVLGE